MADIPYIATNTNSIVSAILAELGLFGWSLQDGSYNGCTFTSFVQVPALQNNPIVQNGLDLIAEIQEISGYSPFQTDPNGLGRLFNTVLGTLQFDDDLHIHTVIKDLPFADRCNTESMGLGGYTFRLSLLFVGPDYQRAIRNFENVIVNPPATQKNVLVHPTRGLIDGVTRITEFRVNTSFKNYNAAVVNVTFRSELSTGGVPATSKLQDFANALEAALAIISGIYATLGELGAFVSAGNRLTTGQQTNQVNSQYEQVSTNTAQVTNVLLNSVNYIYKTSGTTIVNSGLDSLPINYQQIPKSLNSVERYSPSQADIIMNNYIKQCETLIANIMTTSFASQCNNLINNINESIGTLNQVCVNAVNYVISLTYTTPRLMSIRGVVAANGIPFSSIPQIMSLNPQLLSANYIPKGTTVVL